MANLFISYTQEDQKYVEGLKASLKKLKIIGDWEPVEISLQKQEIDEAIRGRLEAADAVVIVLSPKALVSSGVLFEIGAAQASGKKIVPIILPDTDLDQIDFLDKSLAVLDAGTLSLSETAEEIEARILENS